MRSDLSDYEKYQCERTQKFRSRSFKLLRKLLAAAPSELRDTNATPQEIAELCRDWLELISMAIHGFRQPPPGFEIGVEVRYGPFRKEEIETAEEVI